MRGLQGCDGARRPTPLLSGAHYPEMRGISLVIRSASCGGRSQGGLGIGLTLVKKLVELHGGTVEARSAGLNKGAEFIVRLPILLQDRDKSTESGNTASAQSSSKLRLLVVDDNEDAAESLAMLLRLQGHDVRVAHDGVTALEAADYFLPALIFLDIGMPGMDGYEVARRLRKMPALQNTVLAALTGWGQAEDRRRSASRVRSSPGQVSRAQSRGGIVGRAEPIRLI